MGSQQTRGAIAIQTRCRLTNTGLRMATAPSNTSFRVSQRTKVAWPAEISWLHLILAVVELPMPLPPGFGKHPRAESAIMRRDTRSGAVPVVERDSVGRLVLFRIDGHHHGNLEGLNEARMKRDADEAAVRKTALRQPTVNEMCEAGWNSTDLV